MPRKRTSDSGKKLNTTASQTKKATVSKEEETSSTPVATKRAKRTRKIPHASKGGRKRVAPPDKDFAPGRHHDEIERLAYALWQQRGCAHGGHEEDWRHAEAEVRRKYISTHTNSV